MKKRIISMLMATLMLLSVATVVGATDGTTTEETTVESRVFWEPDIANMTKTDLTSMTSTGGNTPTRDITDGKIKFASTSTTTNSDIYLKKSALSSTANYDTDKSSAYRKLTMDFSIEDLGKNATLIWQSLAVMTYENAKTWYGVDSTAYSNVYKDSDVILCMDKSGSMYKSTSTQTLYPLCTIEDVTQQLHLEYIYRYSVAYPNYYYPISIKLGDKLVTSVVSSDGTVNSFPYNGYFGDSPCKLGQLVYASSGSVMSVRFQPTYITDPETGEKITNTYKPIMYIYDVKYEGIEQGKVPSVVQKPDFTNIVTTGNVSLKFDMDIDPETVAFTLEEKGADYYASDEDKTNGTATEKWWERVAPTEYEYDEETYTYTLKFANVPLTEGYTYRLTMSAGVSGAGVADGETTESVEIGTFVPKRADKYYINENFARYKSAGNLHYQNTATDLNEREVAKPWVSYVSNGSNVVNSFTTESEKKVFRAAINSAKQGYVSLYFDGNKLPEIGDEASEVKIFETSIKFNGLMEGAYIDIFTPMLTVRKEGEKAYLYIDNGGSSSSVTERKIAEVTEDAINDIKITFSAEEATARTVCSVAIGGTEYTTTSDGERLDSLELPEDLSPYYFEMEYVANDPKIFTVDNRSCDADAVTAAAKALNLYVYEVKYYSYEAPSDATYTVAAAKGETAGTVTLTASENAGRARSEKVFVAAYDGKKMLDIKVAQVSLKALGESIQEITLDVGGTASPTYRYFRFESLDSLTPIMKTEDTVIS